jgi:hypothetical protein
LGIVAEPPAARPASEPSAPLDLASYRKKRAANG